MRGAWGHCSKITYVIGALCVAVVLYSGGPADGDGRGACLPFLGRLVVAGVGVVAVLETFGAGGKQVPSEGPVASAGLEGHDRLGGVGAEGEADAELGPDACLHARGHSGVRRGRGVQGSHELVVEELDGAGHTTVALGEDVSHGLAGGIMTRDWGQ